MITLILLVALVLDGISIFSSPLLAQASTPRTPVPGAPAGVTAFVDVAVVPLDRERVLLHQTVLVQDGWITALWPVRKVRVPAGASQIDGRGHYLMPGLADMHAHPFGGGHLYGGFAPFADSAGAEANLFLWLANGATTVRDMDYFSETFGQHALRLRSIAAAGTAWIPTIYTAGEWGPYRYINVNPSIIGRPDTDHQPVLVDSVAVFLSAYHTQGYDFIKVHEEKPEILDSVLAVAHRLGIPVSGHVPPPTRLEHILWGYRSIEHPLTDYLWGARTDPGSTDTVGIAVLAGAMHRAGVWHCVTQSHYDRLHGERPELAKIELDSGVKLLLGTDEPPRLGVLTDELAALVGAGLTPYEALLTGTRNVAEYFGTLDQRGTIMIGKRADLVLLTGNPLQDVRYTAQPVGVMLGGRWLSREQITERVTQLTLPTADFVHGLARLPIKSYWANVAEEWMETALPVLGDGEPFATITTLPDSLKITFATQWQALTDSLGTSDQYDVGTQRIVHLVAQQFGVYRGTVPAERRDAIDELMRRWRTHARVRGYVVQISGMPE